MSHTLPPDGQAGHTLEIESKNGVTNVYLDGMEVRYLKAVNVNISHDDYSPLVTLEMEAAEVTIDGAAIHFTGSPSSARTTGVAAESPSSDAGLMTPLSSLSKASAKMVPPVAEQVKGMTRFPAGSYASVYRDKNGLWYALNSETGMVESHPPFMSEARSGFRLYTFKCPSCSGTGTKKGVNTGLPIRCRNCDSRGSVKVEV